MPSTIWSAKLLRLLPGLRHVTIERAIYWFDVPEAERTVRVLAVFFGGQDDVRHMLERLLSRRWLLTRKTP